MGIIAYTLLIRHTLFSWILSQQYNIWIVSLYSTVWSVGYSWLDILSFRHTTVFMYAQHFNYSIGLPSALPSFGNTSLVFSWKKEDIVCYWHFQSIHL